jgi:hypothetical protein
MTSAFANCHARHFIAGGYQHGYQSVLRANLGASLGGKYPHVIGLRPLLPYAQPTLQYHHPSSSQHEQFLRFRPYVSLSTYHRLVIQFPINHQQCAGGVQKTN